MKAKKLPIFQQPEAKEILASACKRHGTTMKLMERLIDLQRSFLVS
jgi:hypothetical protein